MALSWDWEVHFEIPSTQLLQPHTFTDATHLVLNDYYMIRGGGGMAPGHVDMDGPRVLVLDCQA